MPFGAHAGAIAATVGGEELDMAMAGANSEARSKLLLKYTDRERR